MKYVGSKNRLAKGLAPIIQSYIDNNNTTHYMERLNYESKRINEYLILS